MISIEEFYDKWPLYNKQHFRLLSQKYSGRNSKYIIECKKCKKEDSRWGISLLDNEIKCKYCSGASIGEQKIIDILEENNINYIFQYPINIHNHRLSFDFFIPSYSCLIEFDGIQHFFPFEHFGGEKRFEKQCEYDSFKNNYCKEHNIKLVRIKYSDSDKEIYNKLS